jgi:hypothetical protein
MLMGGLIKVESKVGEGSAFMVLLPQVTPDTTPAPAPAQEPVAGGVA